MNLVSFIVQGPKLALRFSSHLGQIRVQSVPVDDAQGGPTDDIDLILQDDSRLHEAVYEKVAPLFFGTHRGHVQATNSEVTELVQLMQRL